jgi:hypothetical protein
LLNPLAQLAKDFFGGVNSASVCIGDAARQGGIQFGQTPGLFFFVALKRIQTGADHVKVGFIGARFQTPPNGDLQIGRQIDAMRLILGHHGHSLLPET